MFSPATLFINISHLIGLDFFKYTILQIFFTKIKLGQYLCASFAFFSNIVINRIQLFLKDTVSVA